MKRTHLLAALTGAALTWLGLSVFGLIRWGDSAELRSAPAEESLAESEQEARPQSPARQERGPPSERSSGPLTSLEERVIALEHENAALRRELESSLTASSPDQPLPFPEDLRPGLLPEAFEASMESVLEGFEGVDFVAVDCSEYPCIAYLQPAEGAPLDQSLIQEISSELMEEVAPEDPLGMMASVVDHQDEEGESRAVLALAPLAGQPSSAEQQRIQLRTESVTEELLSEESSREAD